MEITFEQIYNYQREVMKGQKNFLIFLCMAPFLLFFGGAMGGVPGAIVFLLIFGCVCYFRGQRERTKLKNLKKGNYTVERDVLVKKTIKRYRHNNSGSGSTSWYIQTQKVYPSNVQVVPSIYDYLEEGDEIAIIKAGGKLVTICNLRLNSLSPELYSKMQ